MGGVLFKIDFENVFDKMIFSSTNQQGLHMKDFCPKSCEWVARFIPGGSMGIGINDDIGQFFQTLKGLRQAGPISHVFL
jgi:hypothetical protein